MPDPSRCIVVVEDAGNVGLRISDAQAAHEAVVTVLRKRMGSDAVVYEGAQKNAVTMKRMLGSRSETTIQDDQLSYHAAAAKAAPWRVRVRFGQKVGAKKSGEHWITVGCRKAADKPTGPVEEIRFVGKNFVEAKEKLDAALPGFCMQLPSTATSLPDESKPAAPGEIPGLHKKTIKPWTPPPRRE